jgi:pimeloyl-ACP methyl ester carboxylesterase
MGNWCRPKTETVKNANLVLEPDHILKERAYAIEREIILEVKLKIGEDIFIENVPIDFMGPNYIHTIMCKKKSSHDKPDIVFIHGYQGSGVLFYKLLNGFVEHFNVYCFDMIGMGLSSRPQVEFDTPEKYIEFFLTFIELWRIAVGLTKFYLVGHSLGGYFSALYTLRFPDNVIQLTLVSPAGITDFNKEEREKKLLRFSATDKVIMKMFKFFNIEGMSLQQIAQNSVLMNKFIKRYLKRHLEVPKKEKAWVTNLLILLLKFPNDLNWTIFHIFDRPLPIAKIPIEDRLKSLPKTQTIDIYYGEKDWMDQFGAKRLHEYDPQCFRIITIPKYGHNFIIEDPRYFQKHFLDNYKNRTIIRD